MKCRVYRVTLALVAFSLDLFVTRRTNPSRNIEENPERFGIDEIVVEKRSSSIPDALATEEDVKREVLRALAAIALDPDQSQCPFTLEPILKNGKILFGGLVAVVEEQHSLAENPEKPFRVQFSTLPEFHRWVEMKPVDIHTNKLFADEPLAWVLRLTDGTDESKTSLPSLFPTREATSLASRYIRTFEVRANPLMPGLVPQGGIAYLFKLRRRSLFHSCSLQNMWKWTFAGSRSLQRGRRDYRRGNVPVMVALGPSLGFNREWRVLSPFFRQLFWVKAQYLGFQYKILTTDDRSTLFTLSIRGGFGPSAMRAASVVIRQGDSGDVVYNGACIYNGGTLIRFDFYHGAAQESVAARYVFEPSWTNSTNPLAFTMVPQHLEIEEGSDSALLLVAVAILSD